MAAKLAFLLDSHKREICKQIAYLVCKGIWYLCEDPRRLLIKRLKAYLHPLCSVQFVGRAGIDEETGRSIEDDGVGRIDISIEKIDDCFWGDSVGFISKDCIPIDSMENIDDSTLRDSVGFTFRDGIS